MQPADVLSRCCPTGRLRFILGNRTPSLCGSSDLMTDAVKEGLDHYLVPTGFAPSARCAGVGRARVGADQRAAFEEKRNRQCRRSHRRGRDQSTRRALRPDPPAVNPAAQSDALRGPAEDAHSSRIPILHHVHSSLQRNSIPYRDLARPSDPPDGAVEGPLKAAALSIFNC